MNDGRLETHDKEKGDAHTHKQTHIHINVKKPQSNFVITDE